MDHPMNPAIRMLAAKYQIGFANRLTWRKYVYDGKNIACWWYSRKQRRAIPLSDHDLAHEIAHFVAAKPEQRDLPEFGMGYIGLYNQAYTVDVLDDLQESTIQEMVTQALCIIWGRRYNFSPILSAEPFFVSSWDEYETDKIKERNDFCSEIDRAEIDRRISLLLNEGH